MSKNLRKKCLSCDLICFAADEACPRCDSNRLETVALRRESPLTKDPNLSRRFPFLTLVFCFTVSLVIEFFALFPVLANLGMKHAAAAAPTESEIRDGYLAFIFHLPTVLFPICSIKCSGWI